jgi:predicted Zn-dependent protease
LWVRFHGIQRADGVVIASDVSFRLNTVGEHEEKVSARTEHDPASVNVAAEQSTTSMLFRGVDPSRIPPYKDEKMQSRVSSIGEKLVPKYQRELATTDRTKINFRFQVVEEKNLLFSFAWPNGIVLVPSDLVEFLKDDSQLAAVLADSVANVLEKHPFGIAQSGNKRLAGTLLGLASPLDTLYALSHKSVFFGANTKEDLEQSGRVSLCLMHDAGYDVHEAPRAWWVLADTKSKGLDKTPLPARSEYLYKFLGETWHGQ